MPGKVKQVLHHHSINGGCESRNYGSNLRAAVVSPGLYTDMITNATQVAQRSKHNDHQSWDLEDILLHISSASRLG